MAKILIVDDSKIIRNMLFNMLNELGHEVVGQAEDGEEGYEMFKTLNPDLVTMDINMPKMDGFSTVQKIIAEFPEAKIIMVSSIDDRTLTYDCIGEGALDFISKPILMDELKEKIEEALEE